MSNYGHMDDRFMLVYLPTRPEDLAGWLGCLNAAVRIRPTGIDEDRMGHRHYMWQLVGPLK